MQKIISSQSNKGIKRCIKYYSNASFIFELARVFLGWDKEGACEDGVVQGEGGRDVEADPADGDQPVGHQALHQTQISNALLEEVCEGQYQLPSWDKNSPG